MPRSGWIWPAAFAACLVALATNAAPLEIQLPAETATFKQDTGAEIANGQCLTCHSVEYISMQPAMPRAFWKSSVQKMQQKYGAPIPEDQVEAVVDYLTRNYGVVTNGATAAIAGATNSPSTQATAAHPATDGTKLAMKYGCFNCHNATVKIVGPAYREIAAKYKSDNQALAKIDEQIHKGGSGKWGPMVMPPFPQVSANETKILADWILGLK
jgi:sulfite dehydrogenase